MCTIYRFIKTENIGAYEIGRYKKRLLLRYIRHFISDLIHNMDQMRISGNEPSSVILGPKVIVSKVGK